MPERRYGCRVGLAAARPAGCGGRWAALGSLCRVLGMGDRGGDARGGGRHSGHRNGPDLGGPLRIARGPGAGRHGRRASCLGSRARARGRAQDLASPLAPRRHRHHAATRPRVTGHGQASSPERRARLRCRDRRRRVLRDDGVRSGQHATRVAARGGSNDAADHPMPARRGARPGRRPRGRHRPPRRQAGQRPRRREGYGHGHRLRPRVHRRAPAGSRADAVIDTGAGLAKRNGRGHAGLRRTGATVLGTRGHPRRRVRLLRDGLRSAVRPATVPGRAVLRPPRRDRGRTGARGPRTRSRASDEGLDRRGARRRSGRPPVGAGFRSSARSSGP